MSETDPVIVDLLGNQDIRDHLLTLSRRNELHHCLLFEGPPGLGKAASARWLAQAINCMEEDEGARPCGRCWSCRSIHTDQHPDVLQIGLDPQRAAPIISVRQAREVISKLALRPYRARRRLIIIDPADAMKAEAANALLKTFEEPPQDTGFILVCASARRLLTTVRSRSQRIRFRPIALPALETWLAEQGVAEPHWLARLSDGCPGRALALADGQAQEWRAQRDALLEALNAPIEARFKYTEQMTSTRGGGGRSAWVTRVEVMLDALQRLVRDSLAMQHGTPPERLYNADRLELVAAWADQLQLAGCERIGQAIDKSRQEMAAYVNGRLMLDALLSVVVAELGAESGR
ncbi:MAG: DNA polymerase III subunit delta' [Myxococcota bacterium]